MLEIFPQGPSGLSGKICLCGIGAAGTKVMEEVLLLAPQSASVCAMNLDAPVERFTSPFRARFIWAPGLPGASVPAGTPP